MPFRNFDISNIRALQRAKATDLPNLVLITGPNGVGKSTLLSELWHHPHTAEAGTHVVYIGPSRPQRKTPLTRVTLDLISTDLMTALGLQAFPPFQYFVPPGLQFLQGSQRNYDTPDETFSLTKLMLNKLEIYRRDALTYIHDRDGSVPPGAMPDVYTPLRDLLSYLLPHLAFERVDLDDPNNLRCLFRRFDAGLDVMLDLDDLSSGEKAVISLFMPFIEQQVIRRLADAGAQLPSFNPSLSITALIDEPEIHIHPELQTALLSYLRSLSAPEHATQFIMTTHSTALIDAALNTELFMLVPMRQAVDGNQFQALSTDHDRLQAIRGLTGSAAAITRARPIVFVEGEAPEEDPASDKSLLGLLVPESASWVIVSARGREQAVSNMRALRSTLSHEVLGIPVFALIDRDQSQGEDDETTITWPVAMIENLLLDPDAISALLTPHGTELSSGPQSVKAALEAIAEGETANEIRIRVHRLARSVVLRPAVESREGIDVAIEAVTKEVDRYLSELSGSGDKSLSQALEAALGEVEAIVRDGAQLERFRGKAILKRFCHEFVRQIPYPAFTIELAQRARMFPRLGVLVSEPIARIQRYVPTALLSALDEATAAAAIDVEKAARVRAVCVHAINCWKDPSQPATDLDDLRRELHGVATEARMHGGTASAQRISELAAQIGLNR